jgi:hypothetical protein
MENGKEWSQMREENTSAVSNICGAKRDSEGTMKTSGSSSSLDGKRNTGLWAFVLSKSGRTTWWLVTKTGYQTPGCRRNSRENLSCDLEGMSSYISIGLV